MNSIIINLYCLSKWIFFLWIIFSFNLSQANVNDICQYEHQDKVSIKEYLTQISKKNVLPISKIKNFAPNMPKVGLKNPMVHPLLEELFDTLSPFLIHVRDYLEEENGDIPSSRHYTYQLGSQHPGCIHTIYMSRILSDRSIKNVSLQVKGITKERGGVKRIFFQDILSPDAEERAFIENIEQSLQEAKWAREYLGNHPNAIKEGPIKFTTLEEIAENLPNPNWQCSAHCKNPTPYQPSIPYITGALIPGGPPKKVFRSGVYSSQDQAFVQLKKLCQTYSEVYHTPYHLLSKITPWKWEYANKSNSCRKVYPETPNITFDLHKAEKIKHKKNLSNRLNTWSGWIGY